MAVQDESRGAVVAASIYASEEAENVRSRPSISRWQAHKTRDRGAVRLTGLAGRAASPYRQFWILNLVNL